MHIPGLKVAAPDDPYDAKGCLIAAMRDDNPVIFVEHRLLHFLAGHVPRGLHRPLARRRIAAAGNDVTVVGISHMAVECLRARQHLASGVSPPR